MLSLAGQTLEPEAPPRPEELGLPVLEVFVRRNAETGGYEQQAAALYAPEGALAEVAEDAAGEGVAETIAEMIASGACSGRRCGGAGPARSGGLQQEQAEHAAAGCHCVQCCAWRVRPP